MHILSASSLLALALAFPAAAQIQPTYAGVYDAATQRLLPPGSSPTADGGASLVDVYNNDDAAPGFTLQVPSDSIELNWGNFDSSGQNAILQLDIGYSTKATVPIDIILYLMVGTFGNGEPGKGIAVPLSGLPSSDDGTTVAYVITVDLGTPFVAEDGERVGIGLHFPDATNGGLSGHLVPATKVDAINKMARYRTNGDWIFDFVGDDIGVTHATMHCVLRGTEPDFPDDDVVKVLNRKDSLRGVIESGETDVLRYDAFEGELLDLTVAGSDGLFPMVSVVSLPDESVIATVGDGNDAKLKLKKLEIPGTGSYDIRVSGAEAPSLGGEPSTGSYALKVKGRVPATVKKPDAATTPQLEGEELTSFVAHDDMLLSAVVKPAVKGDGGAPVLMGPMGEVSLAGFVSSKNGVHKIKNLPLPSAGGYVLEAGADPNGQTARVKLRELKSKSGKLSELERGLVGAWVADDFNTPLSNKTIDLGPGKDDDSAIVITQGQYVVNPNNPNDVNEYTVVVEQRFDHWKVNRDATDTVLSWQLDLPVKVFIDGDPVDGGGTLISEKEASVISNPDGDPDRVLLEGTGEVWRRDVYGVTAPTAVGVVASDPTDEGDGGASVPGLRMSGPASAVAYRIHKGTTDELIPGALYAIVRANGAGTDGSTEWVDMGADGTVARYWVRTVDENGNLSAHTTPIDVTP